MKTLRFSLLLTGIFLMAFASCKKDDPTYKFTVKTVLEDGRALPNMFVEATADVPNAIPNFSGITNEDGEVSFEYEYEAVLKIRATRGSNPPSWMGCQFIKLEANEDVSVTVVVTPYDPSQPGC